MNIDKISIIPVLNQHENDDYDLTDLPIVEWYEGPSVMEMISESRASIEIEDGQCILRAIHCFTNSIIGCKVRRGTVSVGDNIKIFPSGIRGKVISIHKHSVSVDEARCGDIVTLKVNAEQKLLRNVKPGAMVLFDEDPSKEESIEIPYRFNAVIHVLPSWKENEQKFPRDRLMKFMYSTHDLTSQNGRTRCRIISIDWKQNGRAARVKMEVDSGDSFQFTPLSVRAESRYFFMEFVFSKNGGNSLVFGKVTDILETKTICSIYRHRRQDRYCPNRTVEVVQNPARFSDIYALERLNQSIQYLWIGPNYDNFNNFVIDAKVSVVMIWRK